MDLFPPTSMSVLDAWSRSDSGAGLDSETLVGGVLRLAFPIRCSTEFCSPVAKSRYSRGREVVLRIRTLLKGGFSRGDHTMMGKRQSFSPGTHKKGRLSSSARRDRREQRNPFQFKCRDDGQGDLTCDTTSGLRLREIFTPEVNSLRLS